MNEAIEINQLRRSIVINQSIQIIIGANIRYVLNFFQSGIFSNFSPTFSDMASPVINAISDRGSTAIS